MTKRKTTPDPTALDQLAEASRAERELTRSEFEAMYNQALAALNIDVPVYACRLVGTRLEFHLYGGRVLTWPEDDPHTIGKLEA